MAYEWRDFALDFHSAAFTSQDLNDLETLLGAANLFSSSTTNYFHAGIDFVNPDTVLWTDAYGWNFYSRYYPTLSLNGVLTGMSIQQPSAVPVPAAAWLLGSGLLGMVAIARRRRG
jgi:hypothetical protein